MRAFGHDPFSDIISLQEQIERLFRETRGRQRRMVTTDAWQPLTDIAATSEAYYIRLDLAGVAKDDVSVAMQDDALLVRGVKKPSMPDEARVVRNERIYGAFSRAIPLPSDVDEQDVAANFSHGVLELRIGRRGLKGPREIPIERR